MLELSNYPNNQRSQGFSRHPPLLRWLSRDAGSEGSHGPPAQRSVAHCRLLHALPRLQVGPGGAIQGVGGLAHGPERRHLQQAHQMQTRRPSGGLTPIDPLPLEFKRQRGRRDCQSRSSPEGAVPMREQLLFNYGQLLGTP